MTRQDSGRLHDGFVPGSFAIDGYGAGGFRFAGMSHRGSILALPSGIRAWDVETAAQIDQASLAPLLAEAADIELLLIGTGTDLIPLAAPLRRWLAENGLRTDAMSTRAAAMTFNVLLDDKRRVAAALIAVA